MPRPSKSQPDAPTGPRLVKRTTSKAPAPAEITHEQIAMRAYEFFQMEGGLHGRHVDHWLRAERELKTFVQPPAKRAAANRTRG